MSCAFNSALGSLLDTYEATPLTEREAGLPAPLRAAMGALVVATEEWLGWRTPQTAPVRFYDEDREEVEVQAVGAQRICPRCGRLPGCLCHLLEPKPEVVVSFEDREEIDVDAVTMQDEVEEADKVYDADRPHLTIHPYRAWRPDTQPAAETPHKPTQEEQEAFWAGDRWEDPTAPTVGELIDRLTIVNIKIYHLEDTVMESEDSETVAAAAKKTRTLNRERSDLKNAITRLVQGNGARMDTKT